MNRREAMITLGAAAVTTAVGTIPAAAQSHRASPVGYGFRARLKAKPGMGEALVNLLFNSPSLKLAECPVFLIGRSKSDPDVVFVTEGWTSDEAHKRFFGSDIAKPYIAMFGSLVEETTMVDEITLGGKAVLS